MKAKDTTTERLARIERALRKMRKETDTTLGKEEAAAFLQMSTSTLDRIIKRNELPYYKIGSVVIFYKSELIDYIDAHRVSTEEEIIRAADNYCLMHPLGI